jgi:hypothetical protein
MELLNDSSASVLKFMSLLSIAYGTAEKEVITKKKLRTLITFSHSVDLKKVAINPDDA